MLPQFAADRIAVLFDLLAAYLSFDWEGEVFLYASQEKFLMNVSDKEDISEEIQ